MPNSSKRSSGRLSNSPFVPSPRWLSESPAFQGVEATPPNPTQTPRVDYPGDAGPQTTPPIARLRSPVPPPPSNLFQGNATAFNVDPGVPFLATVGGSSDGGDGGRSEMGSPDKATPTNDRKFVGGFVTGLKKVVRKSLRERPKPEAHSNPSSEPRESGYEMPIPHLPPGQSQYSYGPGGADHDRHSYSSSISSEKTAHSGVAPSETLVGHMQGEKQYTEENFKQHQTQLPVTTQEEQYMATQRNQRHSQSNQRIASPEIIGSPISADPDYGPDYARMDPPTPPPSNASLNTYLKRLQHFVESVNNLPWVGKERVTADYYPDRERRSDEPKRHPAFVWRSDETQRLWQQEHLAKYGPPTHESLSERSAMSGSDNMPNIRAPRRASRSAMDLDAEFEGSRTPYTQNQQPLQAPPLPATFILLQTGPQPTHTNGYSPLPDYPPLPLYPPQQQGQQYPPPPPVNQNERMSMSVRSTVPPQQQQPQPLSQPPPQQTPRFAATSWTPAGSNLITPKAPTAVSPGQTPFIPHVPPSASWTSAPTAPNLSSDVNTPRWNSTEPPRQTPSITPESLRQLQEQIREEEHTNQQQQQHIRAPSSNNHSSTHSHSRAHSRASSQYSRNRESQNEHRSHTGPTGYPSRESLSIHLNSDMPVNKPGHRRHEDTPIAYDADGFQIVPREYVMKGYVPAHRAEQYYGMQYGPPIHAARPPVVHGTASMPGTPFTTSSSRPSRRGSRR